MTGRDIIAQWLCCGGQCNRGKDDCHKLTTVSQRNRVDSCLAALADAGRVIVPGKPTQGMALAGLAAGGKTDTLADIYRAMIAAGGDDD